MVSITLLAVIVGLLTTVFNTTTKAWTGTEGGNERRRGARSLTDFIGAELRGAMLPVTLSTQSGQPNLQMLINPPATMVPEDCQNPHCIFWQAPLATERTLGDVAELGYYVKWDDSDASSVPSLRRFFVNPTVYDPAQRGPGRNSNFLIYSEREWLSERLLSQVCPATRERGYAGLFADNVLGLWIRFYGLDGREIRKAPGSTVLAAEFDSRIGYTHQYRVDEQGRTKAEQRYLPLSISVSIAQLDSRTAQKLERCASSVRNMVRRTDIADAGEFLQQFREASEKDVSLRSLLPGLQVYETTVLLDNGR